MLPLIPRFDLVPAGAIPAQILDSDDGTMLQERVLRRGHVPLRGHALQVNFELREGFAGRGILTARGFVGGDEGVGFPFWGGGGGGCGCSSVFGGCWRGERGAVWFGVVEVGGGFDAAGLGLGLGEGELGGCGGGGAVMVVVVEIEIGLQVRD